jgi:glutamate-1-semialdehyde 2,1-aminomutase
MLADSLFLLYGAGAGAAALTLPALKARLELSRAKHPSLAGHSRLARRVAALVPGYAYGDDRIFCSDGAPAEVEARRRAGFGNLAALFENRFPKTLKLTAEAKEGLSDLQFTAAYRVPFQYSAYVRERLPVGAFLESSSGQMLRDLDGNQFYDLTGSYGLNVFGYELYKACIEEGAVRAARLGPVLGAGYHPALAYNVRRLKEISGLDEVSFHMSGTEAVMQAVRLARYHSRRSHLVRFCGAYHGWWEGVQPGVGNPAPQAGTYTLKDMDEDSLRVLRTRRDIACVLVNPLQALHPNRNAPGDGSLVDSARSARFDRTLYSDWLRKLREVCTERGIALIFDEILVGFRLAPGGAQEYFGVKADMVTYGKTVAGGLPIGVLCGRRELMRRFYDARPADICFARGTFNAHPYVMTAMQVFLERLPEFAHSYEGLDERWNRRVEKLNLQLQREALPIEIANLSSVWTVNYTRPSRYNWMFQYYLRAEGLALSWVGTGRFLFSLDCSEADYQAVEQRFLAAARAMERDGWWWNDPALTNKRIKRGIFREMLARRLRL